MPPKTKTAGGEKKKLGPRPAHMSEELWALSQNLPLLQGIYSGDVKDGGKSGGAGGKAGVAPPTITRTEVVHRVTVQTKLWI
jgi:hypothetical protein